MMFLILEEGGSVGEEGGANWKVICSETQSDAAATAAAATSGV